MILPLTQTPRGNQAYIRTTEVVEWISHKLSLKMIGLSM